MVLDPVLTIARRFQVRLSRAAVSVACLLTGLIGTPAGAVITELRLEVVEPFADGRSFGAAGSYVRLKGVARGEIDPTAAEYRDIVDLDKAPRNAEGRVEYETDIFILQPAEPQKRNGILLYEATNRGRKLLLPWINDARSPTSAINDPKAAEHAGNGFVFERGYTIVWSGWDPDAPKAGAGMSIRVPIATDAGRPIVQRIRHEFQIATRSSGDGLKVTLPYPAHSLDPAKARLTVRTRERDERVDVANWAFIDRQTIHLTGDGVKFEPLKIYDLWYEAQDPKVLGLGYVATRDLVSFLRHQRADPKGTPNPVMSSIRKPGGAAAVVSAAAATTAATATGITHTLAIGISQSGRYLRHFLELGMNADADGRRVFDGMFVHIAGAGKVFGNHRFGMPNRTATQHEDRHYPENWFPFSALQARDPFTGREGRLLTGTPIDPKLIEVNTSTEYWQKGASLIHTDPEGRRDAKLPGNVRAYLIAGTQHGGRAWLDDKPGTCALPRNPHNPAPALRALLVALETWVTDERPPPASRVPRIETKTAVPAPSLRFPALRGIAPPADVNPITTPADWIDPPARNGQSYGALVPALDADGNETAGVRLPPIAVPTGTFVGWNYYRAAPSELCDRDGAYIAFAKTPAEREAAGDGRKSLAERYKSTDVYVTRVRIVSEALVRLRLLLPKDAEAYVDAARGVAF